MRLFAVNDVKRFMNTLLKDDFFCEYETRGIVLQSFTKFEISCRRDNSFFDGELDETPRFCTWGELQPVVFELIKGKKTPKLLKIVMSLNGEKANQISDNALALTITLKYENNTVSALTGCSQKEFRLDKTVDNAWDAYVYKIFKDGGYEVTEIVE